MPMISAIRGILHRMRGDAGAASVAGQTQDSRQDSLQDSRQDFRIAAAAMLVAVANADRRFLPEERAAVSAALVDRLGLDAADARELILLANTPQLQDDDIGELADALRAQLDADGRKAFVALMWDIAAADGDIAPSERALIAQVAAMFEDAPQDAPSARSAAGR